MSDKTCFVIAPIGPQESETRKRSDQVLKHIIRPAANSCGYNAIRADEISEPGIITSQVIQHIVDDPLVVADLTERNPNVFYELALRHALRKPLVQIMAKGEPIPFDVAGTRTIPVDHHDLDSVEEAKAEIIKQIEAVEKPGAKIETPISVAVDLQSLRESDNPVQRTLADLLAAVADLRSAIVTIEKRMRHSEAVFQYRFPADPLQNPPITNALLSNMRNYLTHRSTNDPETLDDLLRLYESLREAETKKKPPAGKE